ncbi:hypothetical protein [Dactylosporangium darangshiense]|uniref:PH domain-containing protein n=1 Tax=Dactylosporangium darangshiense TaxID=579108 RepID=A0ABP8D1X3_9ACTN
MTPGRFERYVMASKATAAAVALVLVALRVLDEFGLGAGTPVVLAVAAKLAPIFVLSAAFIAFGIVFRPLHSPPPAALRIRGGAFVVPGSPILMGRMTMGWALLGTVFLDSDPSLSPTTRLGVNAGAALVIAGAAWPLLRGPRLAVTPSGLNIRAGGRRVLRWDDLVRVPMNPLPLTVRGPKLALSIRRPGRDDPGWLLVPLDLLAVEPVFLGTVVEHYVENPERRPAIGTPEEYARLTGTPA